MNHKLLNEMLEFTGYIAACASTSSYESDIIAEIRKLQPQIKAALAAPERSGKTADDQPVAWAQLSLDCPVATIDPQLANYWESKGRNVTALYSHPAASSSATPSDEVAALKHQLWCAEVNLDGAREELAEYKRALATPSVQAVAAGQVPEGWQLVPTHPEQAMIAAFIAEYHRHGGTESGCYRAMLAASPKPPALAGE